MPYPWFRHLTAIWLMATLHSPAQAAKPRVALVIGNNRYESAVGPLKNAVNDAKAVSKTLRGLGFTVTEEHNVTRDELMEAVTGFRERVKDSEVSLFYFAGHGISVGGSNYLLPVKSGYQPAAGDATAMRLLAETKLFNADQVVAEMSAAGGSCHLVILDACRSTPVARDPNARDVTRDGLAEMKPPAGSLIAFATDAGRTAMDGEGSNGIYTGEFVKHLQTPGLTIEQVFKRTRAGVMRQSDGNQIPAEYSRLVGNDIYLAGSTPAVPVPPPLPKAEPVKVPTATEINRMAAAGKTDETAEALRLATAANGRGDFAAAPIDALLEKAKEHLKEATGPSSAVETTAATCRTALDLIRDCLPPDHRRREELSAKANNRLGDCFMLMDRPADALSVYQNAATLAPTDAYPLYNRGRAKLALGDNAGARADLEAAAGPKFSQPLARKLAKEALAEIP
jgi:hypothetical protein